MICCMMLSSCNNKLSILENKLNKIDSKICILVKRKDIDDHPVWSTDEKCLALNFSGKWYKVQLREIVLKKIKWRNENVGINTNQASISLMPETAPTTANYHLEKSINGRSLFNSNIGYQAYCQPIGFGTKLVLKNNHFEKEILCSDSLDNWHSPSFSPSGKYLALISEKTGLIIFLIDSEILKQ
jgi:hypothetical protein